MPFLPVLGHLVCAEYWSAVHWRPDKLPRHRQKQGPKGGDNLWQGDAALGDRFLSARFSEQSELRPRVLNLLPAGHHLVANTQSLLGACLTAQNRFREPERLLLQGYEHLNEKFGTSHEKTIAGLQRLVNLYELWGKPEEAAEYRTPLPA
jgi:hypothetical protein